MAHSFLYRASVRVIRLIRLSHRKETDIAIEVVWRAPETVLGEYLEHYDEHRPHRSLGQRAPSGSDAAPAPPCDVNSAHLERTDFLGGLIHEYRMVA